MHSLVVSINMLSLGLDFAVKFERSRDYVLGLNDKVVKVLLLTGQSGTCGTFRLLETFLYHLQGLQIYQLAKLLIQV